MAIRLGLDLYFKIILPVMALTVVSFDLLPRCVCSFVCSEFFSKLLGLFKSSIVSNNNTLAL